MSPTKIQVVEENSQLVDALSEILDLCQDENLDSGETVEKVEEIAGEFFEEDEFEGSEESEE